MERLVRYTTTPLSFLLFILDAVQVMLGVRFAFKLIGADPGNGFVGVLYSISDPFFAPFRGILPVTAFSGGIVEWSVLLATVMYALFGALLVRLFSLLIDEAEAGHHHHHGAHHAQ
ncbi:MAG: hypothetical protein G01um101425_1021 [Candidatus Peregrinibacteria bacterium Gr01-1014_25]|nr:MAG: hypothetical protein G01um101425_1021 [Candidatus Peregrinibacteria bacterium Gr01-1014_25]